MVHSSVIGMKIWVSDSPRTRYLWNVAIGIACSGTNPIELNFSLKEVSSYLVPPKYSVPLAPKPPSVPQQLGSSAWKGKQTQGKLRQGNSCLKSTSKSRSWQRWEPNLLGHAMPQDKGKTFQEFGEQRKGLTFIEIYTNIQVLAGTILKIHLPLEMDLYMTTLLAPS